MSSLLSLRDNHITKLTEIVGAKNCLTSAHDIEPFIDDWRGYGRGNALAVVLPATTKEVSDLLRYAAAEKIDVVPQGGNTGLSLGATPLGLSAPIILCLRRMVAIRETDKASNVLVVEAGLTLSGAHQAAEGVDRRIPLNLGAEGTAQIGGLVSTNAGGTSALRYGPMRDLVCGIEVVLPDGQILTDLSALKKNNTGYDLKHLFIGAEGTLGVVTAVALRMHPPLRAGGHAWLALSDLEASTRVLTKLQDRFDTAIQAAELVSGNEIDLVLQHIPRARLPFDVRPDVSLMVELGSSDPRADLQAQFEDWLGEVFEEGDILDAVVAQNQAQANDIWHIRHSVSEANKLHGHSLSHDVAVRTSRVPELIARGTAAVQARYPQAQVLIVSHLGDGNVHFIPHFTHDQWAAFADPAAVTAEVMEIVHDLVDELGGTFSAEHGIGRKLVSELARRADPARLELMRGLRGVIDPDRRMNPGALFA